MKSIKLSKKRTALLLCLLGLGTAWAKPATKPQTDKLKTPTPQEILEPFKLPDYLAPLSDKQLTKTLGWVAEPTSANPCHGYYAEPYFDTHGKPILPLDQSLTHINAKTSRFVKHGVSTLLGKVALTQNGRIFKANRAYVYQNPKTGALQNAEFFDHVSVREPGKYITGKRAHLYFDSNKAVIDQATYRIAQADSDNHIYQAKRIDAEQHIYALNAWGRAIRLEQLDKGLIQLQHASYSTCPPDKNTWTLTGSTILLNQKTGRGDLYNGVLSIHTVPIAYLPYFNFPIDKRRKTGLLYPSYAYDKESGVMISTPFYWNMAPNIDMLLTPKFMGHRGAQLQDLFRYLNHYGHGRLFGTFLPDDAVFKKKRDRASAGDYPGRAADFSRLNSARSNRGAFSFKDTSQWTQGFSSAINYNYVSDDYYFEDFDQIPGLGTSASTAQLDRNLTLNYNQAHLQLQGLLKTYQTLHPVNQARIGSPYSQMPTLTLKTQYPDKQGVQYALNAQYTDFVHTRTPGTAQVVTGERIHGLPNISLPLTWQEGSITPRILADVTQYNLNDQTLGQPQHPFRAVPIFDITGSLHFNKQLTAFKHHYTQTLTPQVYYAYVPYKNQSDIPLFDSSEPALSVPQMLTYNRFSGLDRIGDTNRMTLALTTRFLDNQSGQEALTAQVAQMLYFSNRRVSLSGEDRSDLSSTSVDSPLVGSAAFRLFPDWTLKTNVAWRFDHETPLSQNTQFHYQSNADHIFNIGYSFSQMTTPVQVGGLDVNRSSQIMGDNPKELMTSLYWVLPLPHWHVFGFADYDVGNKHALGTAYGLEYDSCCWGIRVMNSRAFHFLNAQSGQNIYNNTTIVQIVLKGLGVASNSSVGDLLSGNITGFEDKYQKGSFL